MVDKERHPRLYKTYIILFIISILELIVVIQIISNSITTETKSPSDWIKTEDLYRTNKENFYIKIQRPYHTAQIENTNSMDPVIDENSTILEFEVLNPEELHEGDIISYKYNNEIIIHRIIKISSDEKGWYCITKGDNNYEEDPFKIRFENIVGVTVGILY